MTFGQKADLAIRIAESDGTHAGWKIDPESRRYMRCVRCDHRLLARSWSRRRQHMTQAHLGGDWRGPFVARFLERLSRRLDGRDVFGDKIESAP